MTDCPHKTTHRVLFYDICDDCGVDPDMQQFRDACANLRDTVAESLRLPRFVAWLSRRLERAR